MLYQYVRVVGWLVRELWADESHLTSGLEQKNVNELNYLRIAIGLEQV